MEQPTTTTTPVIQLTSLVSVFKEVPAVKELTTKLERASLACSTMLEELQAPTNDEEYEHNNQVLATVRDQYTKMMAIRKPVTEQTDEFKEFMMQFEKPFNPQATKSNPYLEKRKYQEDYQQQKLEKIRKEQELAAKRKELENHKVDLRTKMLENLSNMLITVVKRVDSSSKDFFDAATLDDFDKKAEMYRSNKPKLKKEEYDACFQVTFTAELIKPDEVAVLVNSMKEEETFDKWNTALIESISPVINAWRARIPDLKKQKLELQEMQKKNQEEATKLAEEQKKKNEEEFQKRQQQIDTAGQEQKQQIQSDANLQKMGNEFQAQATTQNLGETGPIKFVLKFVDAKQAPKAFIEILYHVMSNSKFMELYPMFQKRDNKTKKLLFDEKNRPIYIPEVQWWVDFFLSECNGNISGTLVTEDVRIQVRK